MTPAMLAAVVRQLAEDYEAQAQAIRFAAEQRAVELNQRATAWRSLLEQLAAGVAEPVPTALVTAKDESWRERIWHIDAEMRLTVAEVAEVMNVQPLQVYRRIRGKDDPLPSYKLKGGGIEIIAGEFRAWYLRNVEARKRGILALRPRRRKA